MAIKIAGIDLPEDIQWLDEFSGHGVGQAITPTLTGALVIEETAQVDGRKITLDCGGASWVDRTVVESLYTLAATPLADDTTLLLEWGDGRTFDVVFDRSRGQAFEAAEVMRLAAAIHSGTHPYTIKLNLLVKAS